MYHTGSNAYQHSASNTVEDKNLILLKLYDGAIRFVKLAKMGIAENRVNIRGENISKVMAIITELDCALDMEKGEQLVRQLASLYRYTMDRLTQANSQNDLDALNDVENILVTLKEGFEGAARQQQPKKTTAVASVHQEHTRQEGLRFAV